MAHRHPTHDPYRRPAPRPLRDSSRPYTWAAWAPDGRRVVVSGAEAGKGSRLYLQEVQGGDPRSITEEGVRLEPGVSRAVSPDGKWVVALGPDQESALYPVDGGEPRAIPGLGRDLVAVGWTDSPSAIFARPRGFHRRCLVYRVDVASGRRQLWEEVGPPSPTGSPWVERIQVSPDGRRYAYSYRQFSSDLYVTGGVLATPP